METSLSSKRQKRSAEDALTSSNGGKMLTVAGDGSCSSGRSSFQTLVLEQQMHQLKAELEHERSMRKLDGKVARQSVERLEKQIELSEKVAKEATTTLEDYRRTSETRINTLRETHDRTLQQLRECEIKLLHQEEDQENDDAENEATMVLFYKNKCDHLQSVLDQNDNTEKDLQRELADLRNECRKLSNSGSSAVSVAPSAEVKKLLEDAPPAMMKELHRIRTAFAESQRNERQLKRKTAELEERSRHLIQEREEFRSASQRLTIVQKQLEEVHGKYAKIEAEHQAWQQFGRLLSKVIKIPPPPHLGPPDISTVERAMVQARSRGSDAEAQSETLREERHRLHSEIEAKDGQIRELEEKISIITRERSSLENKLEESQSQVGRSKAQQDVYKREAESLRCLVQTFDGLPLASTAESEAADMMKSSVLDTSKRTLAISLDTAKRELQFAQSENERLERQVSASSSELDRVKEKFGKLKEALQAERAKAADSEQRANAAEALAGKGSFDPGKSRVVHYTETPLVEALKEEISVLKRQLEAGEVPKSSTISSHHNPDKLNQRLKENFKEQIALFREGVYLMTGFKVDMLPNTDRPTFRVRSVYSASEQDHLLLKWPKNAADVSSLDILNTDFAKALTETPSYQYMTKFRSLPAFLASVQLSLFENSTQIA